MLAALRRSRTPQRASAPAPVFLGERHVAISGPLRVYAAAVKLRWKTATHPQNNADTGQFAAGGWFLGGTREIGPLLSRGTMRRGFWGIQAHGARARWVALPGRNMRTQSYNCYNNC